MSIMQIASALRHPIGRATAAAGSVLASGVSAADLTNTIGGIVIALASLFGLLIGISRNNKRNREQARTERRKAYRRGYIKRDRELAQIVSDAAYWRGYALDHRRANAPQANPPIVVPAPLPAEDDDDEGEDDE